MSKTKKVPAPEPVSPVLSRTGPLQKIKAPIEKVVWMDPFELNANDYNPNVVQDQEMRLLTVSVEKTGWIQPVLISPDKLIIDGFHRTTICRLKNWMVPCVVLDLPEAERMMLTIRINRAKGTHVALRMADICKKLIELGMTPVQIAEGIGATMAEIDLLQKPDIFAALNLDKWRYSTAWRPKPVGERKGSA